MNEPSKWRWYHKPELFGQGIGLVGGVMGVIVGTTFGGLMILVDTPHELEPCVIDLVFVTGFAIYSGIIGLINSVANSLIASAIGGAIIITFFAILDLLFTSAHRNINVIEIIAGVIILLIYCGMSGAIVGIIWGITIRTINVIIGTIIGAIIRVAEISYPGRTRIKFP